MLATTPFTMTGPATENIFTHIPKIMPSFLYSSAGLAIELEKPVIGITEPAPPKAPILSYIPIPVKSDAKNTIVISIAELTCASDKYGKKYVYKSKNPCPIAQISPPTKNAFKRDGNIFVFGIFAST